MNVPLASSASRPVPLQALIELLPELRYAFELLGVEADEDLPKVWADRYAHGSPITTLQLERLINALGLAVVKAYGAS